MSLINLRVELRAIRVAINELRGAIDRHSDAVHSAQEGDRDRSSSPRHVQAIVSFDEETKRESKIENDRQYCVQSWIRWAGWCAFGAAVIYAAITAFQWSEMRKATKAATEAAHSAAQQLELSERPWVDADISIDGALVFDRDGAHIPLKIVLRNSGHSPAMHTAIYPVPLIGFRDKAMDFYRKQACDSAASLGRITGISLFPDRALPIREYVGISSAQLRNAAADWKRQYPTYHGTPDDIIAPEMIVCVSYQPSFTKNAYATAYSMSLERLDEKGRPVSLFKIGQPISEKRLLLDFDYAGPPITAN